MAQVILQRAQPTPLGAILATAASICRLHIIAIAVMGTFTFSWLFLQSPAWTLTLAAGIDWFIVNLTNRIVDLPEDRANRIVGTTFVERHRQTLLGIIGVVFLGSMVTFWFLAPAITPLRIAFHALGLAYNYPLLPGRRRVKQLYLFKNMASATGFMITVFGFPIAMMLHADLSPARELTWISVALSAAFFFLFEISYEVIYDLRDVTGDRAEGIRTFPVVHGVEGAQRIIDALAIASMFVLAVGYALDLLPWRIFVMIVAPAIQLYFYRRVMRRGITSRDCVVLTWLGAILLLAFNLWIAAGLPGS